jgi:Transposase DDE domain
VLTEGQASDKTTAPELVAPLGLSGDVVADRGYFGRAVIEAIEASGATAQIPSQSNVRVVRSVDPTLYRHRNLIERFSKPPQTLPCHRHPLQQAHQKLPRGRPARLSTPVAQTI